MVEGPARVALWLREIGAEADRRSEREWSVRVPSARRGAIAVALACRERSVSMRAFFMRGPDRRHEEVYRRLLRKHLDMEVWRFAVDDAGDIWLATEAPLDGLGARGLDGLLGLLSTIVDETYGSVMATGFDVPAGTPVGPPPGGAA